MINVSLNGQRTGIEQARLSDAMATWRYPTGKCAVAINGEFVSRADYDRVILKEGDEIDVVAPIGGG